MPLGFARARRRRAGAQACRSGGCGANAPRYPASVRYGPATLVGLPGLALLLGACGPPGGACASSAACDAGDVCDPAGRCRPLRARRFVTTRVVGPVDWAVAPPARPAHAARPGDVMPLGGPEDLRALLAFPAGALEGDDATLALRPHPDWPGPAERGRLVVRRARPFRGPELAAGEGQPRVASPTASRAFEAGHRGRLLVSLAPLLDGAPGPVVLEVSLVGGGDRPWRPASPDALADPLRPHLEVAGVRGTAPLPERPAQL